MLLLHSLVTAAAWTLPRRARETDRRVYGGGAFNAVLVISIIAIGILGIYTVLSTLGVFKIG